MSTFVPQIDRSASVPDVPWEALEGQQEQVSSSGAIDKVENRNRQKVVHFFCPDVFAISVFFIAGVGSNL